MTNWHSHDHPPLQCLLPNLLLTSNQKSTLRPPAESVTWFGMESRPCLPLCCGPCQHWLGCLHHSSLLPMCLSEAQAPLLTSQLPVWGALLWPPRSILHSLPCPAQCPRTLISRDHIICALLPSWLRSWSSQWEEKARTPFPCSL